MLFQGNKQKDARELNEAFESMGVRKGASTAWEWTRVLAQMVNTKFDATLPLMHEILLTPTFPQNELEQMRSIILQAIRRRDDEPMSRIFDLVRASFFKGSAFARLSLGTTESVQKLHRRDLCECWKGCTDHTNRMFS